MKSVYNFIVTPKGDRYNNKKKIGDKELILNTEIFHHQYISREAIIVGLPANNKSDLKEGDTVIVHHNTFRRWYDMKGKEQNSSSHIYEDLYRVSLDLIYAYKRNNKWRCLKDFSFIQPLQDEEGKEKPLIGFIKYSDGTFKENELVGYLSNAEYEFVIDNKRLYRVKNDSITIKYECQGHEKEYNPSWT